MPRREDLDMRGRGAQPARPPAVAERLLYASRYVDLAWKAFDVVREELALALCDTQARARVTAQLYLGKKQYHYGSLHNRQGLFGFESEAIARYFPAPPARLLVGACGGGREVLALHSAGYEIAGAYDPVPELVEALGTQLGPQATHVPLWVETHETFGTRAHGALGRVDGVLIGWGSYTHVLGSGERVRFLRALRTSCPRGPVLVSFFRAQEAPEGARERFRAAVRGAIGRWARLHQRLGEEGDGFVPHSGFCHWFTEDEIRREAAAAGYAVAHLAVSDVPYPHAVLVPETEQRPS